MEEKVKRMSEAMQFEDHSVDAFISNIEKILDRIKIPKSLSEIGVPEDCVDRIAEKAMKDQAYATNPKPPIIKTVGKIASPSRPSVKLTAFEDPTMTKMLINKNNGIDISNIKFLLNGRMKYSWLSLE